MIKQDQSEVKVDDSSILEDKTSINQSSIYLEQIRDFTYKEVVLADTKAGFALTIVAVSLGASVSLSGKLSMLQSSWANYVTFLWITGIICAGFSVLCSMLTILPRSYITHEMTNNPQHWVHMNNCWKKSLIRRLFDAYCVIHENIWQKQTKGTSQSLEMLIKSNSGELKMLNAQHESMKRAFLVQNLKFLWVGKAILFAFLAFSLIGTSLFFAQEIINSNNKQLKTKSSLSKDSNKPSMKSNNEIILNTHIKQDKKEEKTKEIKIKEKLNTSPSENLK